MSCSTLSVRVARSVGALPRTAQRFASTAPAAAATPAAVDPAHKAWLQSVKAYTVVIPRFEWSLEFTLSSPPPLHQFNQSPIVIEVLDRNPNADGLLYQGPNVVGGYPHPDTGKVVSQDEHLTLPFVKAPAQGSFKGF